VVRTVAILIGVGATVFAVLAVGVVAGWFLAIERRPGLLEEAEWQDPDSARAFNRRFADGSREAELLAWLEDNDFEVNPADQSAQRSIGGFPCNEMIDVSWRSSGDARLTDAQVIVREAGCL
jgi:hypothetical protein